MQQKAMIDEVEEETKYTFIITIINDQVGWTHLWRPIKNRSKDRSTSICFLYRRSQAQESPKEDPKEEEEEDSRENPSQSS